MIRIVIKRLVEACVDVWVKQVNREGICHWRHNRNKAERPACAHNCYCSSTTDKTQDGH